MSEEIFSEDLIIEILSRVPAKSLINSFKFVCKSWRILIQDPVFVKLHLSRGAFNGGNNNNNSLICEYGNELFQLHSPFNFEAVAATTTNLDFPSSLLSSFRIRASCNGLLCISEDDETLILVNPCTRKYKVSPRFPTVLPPLRSDQSPRYKSFHHQPGYFYYGFGFYYNSTDNIDEYKVIRIVEFGRFIPPHEQSSCLYQLDIYSMSSNSWRRETRFKDYPYCIDCMHSGTFVNGALHWIAFNMLDKPIGDTWDSIVSFDLRDEEFRLVPVPLSCEPTADDPYFHLDYVILINMKGCLSMIIFPNDMDNDFELDIWVMKEYGIKESWVKDFVIRSSNLDPPRALSGFLTSATSKAYVLKGDQILIEGMEQVVQRKYGSRRRRRSYRERQILYDINRRKIDGDFKIDGVHDQPNINQIDYYETLVSLQSSRPLNNNI